jgi:hypothetical protein
LKHSPAASIGPTASVLLGNLGSVNRDAAGVTAIRLTEVLALLGINPTTVVLPDGAALALLMFDRFGEAAGAVERLNGLWSPHLQRLLCAQFASSDATEGDLSVSAAAAASMHALAGTYVLVASEGDGVHGGGRGGGGGRAPATTPVTTVAPDEALTTSGPRLTVAGEGNDTAVEDDADDALPFGLVVTCDVVTAAEEATILKQLATEQWETLRMRQVLHYGTRFARNSWGSSTRRLSCF